MIFKSKQKWIQAEIDEYCKQVLKCMELFLQAIERYCESGDHERIVTDYDEIHAAESGADDIRRKIEVMMYSKAMFPESRRDILRLLEAMDRVPNHTESTIQMIRDMRIFIPDIIRDGVVELAEMSCRCISVLVNTVETLFRGFVNAAEAVGKIDELETEADHLEAQLIQKLFSSEIDGYDKIILRDFVKHISGICDRAEKTGDQIRILIAKRGI